MFVGAENILPPPACIFTSEDQVSQFQEAAGRAPATIGDAVIELQPAAMRALLARGQRLSRKGWTSRRAMGPKRRGAIMPILCVYGIRDSSRHSIIGRGRPVKRIASRSTAALPINEQVREVLELEKHGIFFSKDLSKSVLYSIAAPGTSQHIAMLAFDANEFLDARVREILAAEGWFQTVLSDLPHFTFLGLKESELPERGLKPVEVTVKSSGFLTSSDALNTFGIRDFRRDISISGIARFCSAPIERQ